MRTILPPTIPVKRVRHAQLYAQALQAYDATLTDQYGTVTGTCRELFAHGGSALEWQATGYYERLILRREDGRLFLGEIQ